MRKHILETVESHEYLFINTFFIAFYVFLFFLYKITFHDKTFDNFITKIKNLTFLQVIYFMIISFITVISAVVIINLDKYFNTPLINFLLSRSVGTVLLILVGVFVYKEKYNLKQIFGIFLTIVGLFLIACKSKEKK
jgi:drug/metabolite transporter (DMT)-like permease